MLLLLKEVKTKRKDERKSKENKVLLGSKEKANPNHTPFVSTQSITIDRCIGINNKGALDFPFLS